MSYEKDLVILVPDKNMQFLLEGLLSMATVLGIRKPSHQLDIHPLRDAGCLDAAELLESQTNRYAHAIVVSNSERSGRANIDRNELEARIEDDLQKSGWGGRARAVVVAPGIGRWLLEHVYQGRWSTGTSAQQELEAALRRKKVPQSPDLYRALGIQLVDEGEPDLAWQKILFTFKSWFGGNPSSGDDDVAYSGPIEGLFSRLEPLSRAGKLDAALDLVFDYVDHLLGSGGFPEVNGLLTSVPVEKLDPAILVGFLTVTCPAREVLDARAGFVVRVRNRLGEQMTPDELASVMQGLA
ncbi:MAG: hypothetical protein ACMG6S_14700 [Byssovorax sp.]